MVTLGALMEMDAPPPGIGIDPMANLLVMLQQQMMTFQAQQQQHELQQQAPHKMLLDLVKTLTSRATPVDGPTLGSEPNTRATRLDEKHFRRVPVFDNKQSTWTEWRTHFLITVRETSSGLADTMVNAEGEENELTVDRLGVETKQLTPLFYSRLMTLMRDVPSSIVETTDGNGVEA